MKRGFLFYGWCAAVLVFGIIAMLSGITWYQGLKARTIALHLPCYRGWQVTLAFVPTNGFQKIRVDDGPSDFQIKARVWTWPGGTAGYIWNSAHVCTKAEAIAYGEREAQAERAEPK